MTKPGVVFPIKSKPVELIARERTISLQICTTFQVDPKFLAIDGISRRLATKELAK